MDKKEITSKTKLILFGKRQLLIKILDVRVPFLGQSLVPVPSVKDLGPVVQKPINANPRLKVNQ